MIIPFEDMHPTRSSDRAAIACVMLAATLTLASAPALAAPPIRTSAENAVPACVTPERLMAFLATRNASPEPRFRTIADHYRRHGTQWRVRWDYAFFQMALETNFLQFRRGNGTPGDVKPRQNNFAGLGTTGGGVPGDSYPDVSTGVLAQVQHLVAYSGERVPDPVGPRTRLKQDDIIRASSSIAARRPLTFQDLSRRWAVDPVYGRSIDTLARLYADRFCPGLDITVALKPEPTALTRTPVRATRPPRPAPRSAAVIRTSATAAPVAAAPAQALRQNAALPPTRAGAPQPVPLPVPAPAARSNSPARDASDLSRAADSVAALRGSLAPGASSKVAMPTDVAQ